MYNVVNAKQNCKLFTQGFYLNIPQTEKKSDKALIKHNIDMDDEHT